ncbi:MAG TPA: pitrilysin family protein [Alphaproteobacteria bacterium]|nr:pitrilysin family protein [Alphaproteobacteria bacterium]
MSADDVTVARLANGMTVATDRVPSVETASVGVWVNAGTRHETPEINGVSHMLEHMAFKGTARRSARQIAEEIEAVGGFINAHTARDHTAYYAKVLKEDVPLAMDILADILQHPALDPAELEREQEVVVQEIAQAIDAPDDIIFDHFQSVAYPDQAVGRPVLGTAELVRSFTPKTLASFIGTHYGPGRMVVAAAGNVRHDEVLEMVTRQFTALPPSTPAPESAPRYAGGEYRESRDTEQVHLVLGFEGIGAADPEIYAASVLSTLLGGGMSSRLFQEVREKRGLVYSIHSFVASFEDCGLFGIYAGTDPKRLKELMPVLCEETAKAGDALTDEEIARARAQLRAGLLMGLERTELRAEQLAQQMLIYGRPIPIAETLQVLEAVDRAAIARVAARLMGSRPTLAALGPLGRLEPFDAIEARFK